jgi:hypothetical protein
MAGPGFVVLVVLISVFVPVWALIWGRQEPPSTVSVVRDRRPQRPELGIGPGRKDNEAR